MSATTYFLGAAFGGPGWLKWFILGLIALSGPPRASLR